ncbi:MAG: 1-acyl-sn-glycerol-3-phosphate acyltransferase [Bacteroidetes bacterium]|nr:1-acyl-sn-glycerol-3-phosphate acyltransferase [Bacteroidota bacterium]
MDSFFLPLYPIFLILLSREEWFKYAFRLKKFGRIVSCSLLVSSTPFATKEKLTPNQAYILTPNHSSYLDILTANIAFPNYFYFMGKAELEKCPALQYLLQKDEHIG